MLADADVELALEPDRDAFCFALALPVEAHRLAGAIAELQLVIAAAKARAAPARLEEVHQLCQPAACYLTFARVLMEAFQHAVNQDAEALVDRRLLGDAEDAPELVLQRAGQVEVEVGCRETEGAVATARQEGFQ